MTAYLGDPTQDALIRGMSGERAMAFRDAAIGPMLAIMGSMRDQLTVPQGPKPIVIPFSTGMAPQRPPMVVISTPQAEPNPYYQMWQDASIAPGQPNPYRNLSPSMVTELRDMALWPHQSEILDRLHELAQRDVMLSRPRSLVASSMPPLATLSLNSGSGESNSGT